MNKQLNLKIGKTVYTYADAVKRFGKHQVDNWYKYPDMLATQKPSKDVETRQNTKVNRPKEEKLTQLLPPVSANVDEPKTSTKGVTDHRETLQGATVPHVSIDIDPRRTIMLNELANPTVSYDDDKSVDVEPKVTDQSNAKKLEDLATYGKYTYPKNSEYDQSELYSVTKTGTDFANWLYNNFTDLHMDDINTLLNSFSNDGGKTVVLHGTLEFNDDSSVIKCHMYNQDGLPIDYIHHTRSDTYTDLDYDINPTNGIMEHGQKVFKLVSQQAGLNRFNSILSPASRQASRQKIKRLFESALTDQEQAIDEAPFKTYKLFNSKSTFAWALTMFCDDFQTWLADRFNLTPDITAKASQAFMDNTSTARLKGKMTLEENAQYQWARFKLYNEDGKYLTFTKNLTNGKYSRFSFNISPYLTHDGIALYHNIKVVPEVGVDTTLSLHGFYIDEHGNYIVQYRNDYSMDDLQSLAQPSFDTTDTTGKVHHFVRDDSQSNKVITTYQEAPDKTHPNYYSNGGKDVIDCLPDLIGDKGTIGFLQGNVIKYTVRFQQKNGVEDLHKAKVYLDRLEQVYKEEKQHGRNERN